MNDEKRKNARLQGRFSDEPRPSRKEKSKRKSDEGTSKRKSLETKSLLQPADGVELQYDAKANDPIPQLEEKKPAVEINKAGEHVLSETENGKSRIIFDPDFIPKDEADCVMSLIHKNTNWHDKNIIIHGQEVPQPRLVAWYGPFPYAYSGAVLEAADMPPAILEIKDRVERYLEAYQLDVSFNSVLLNLYRDGKDSVAWHSDDELTMGVSPTIASVSLGEIRKFQMRIKKNVNTKNLVSDEYFVNLTPGSLIIMDGCMQQDWKHQVPKEYHDRSPRINLTFRTVYPIDKVPLQVPLKTVENSNQPSSTKTDAKQNIFDNTNFPSLESANSLNGNSSKVLKNSSVKPKSKTVPDIQVKAYVSDQSCSDDSLQPDSSSNSNLSENQEMKKSPSQDVSSVVPDSDYQTDAVKEPNSNNESVITSALPGTSESEHPAADNNQASKRYELNADADEFIPKCLPNDSNEEQYAKSEYHKTPLAKLPEVFWNGKVPPSRYHEFYSVIADGFERNPEFLLERDYYEATTLCSLFDNGLSEENQLIVLERLCSMIKNIIHRRNRPYRSAPPRSGYRNTYSRSRGPFRGSGGREKDYKD